MNEYWCTVLLIDQRLREADIPYCVIKSYAGDPDFDDGNVDVVVTDPLWDVYRRAFAADFWVSTTDRWKNRLYERNKLMLSHLEGGMAKIHLHSCAGWHDICFVSGEAILAHAVELELGGRTIRVLDREAERRVTLLHVLFENFSKNERDLRFLSEEDYRTFATEYGISDEEIARVLRTEGAIAIADLRPIWRKYYEQRRRQGAVTWRNRFLHFAIIRFNRVRSLLRRLRGTQGRVQG